MKSAVALILVLFVATAGGMEGKPKTGGSKDAAGKKPGGWEEGRLQQICCKGTWHRGTR